MLALFFLCIFVLFSIFISLLLYQSYFAIFKRKHSEKELINLSKSIDSSIPKPHLFPIEDINNKNDFNYVWNIICYNIDCFSKNGDFISFTHWIIYCIKYYTEDILKYGSVADINLLHRYVEVLEEFNIINAENFN